MEELSISTVKYFWVSIDRFLPTLQELEEKSEDINDKEELADLIAVYKEVQKRINKWNLNFDDPNKRYESEPLEVKNWLSDAMIENLARLSLRLLVSWKEELSKLEKKTYSTDKNRQRIYQLKEFIWPLEEFSKNRSFIIGKYVDKGPLEFPGENKPKKNMDTAIKIEDGKGIVFSKTLTSKIPSDIAKLCDEFNFNYINTKPNAGMLLLRRILPLAIVRKFQSLGKEAEVHNGNDFFDTKALLGKVEGLLSNKRIYKEIDGYKLLIDSSQHSYSLNVDISDVEGAAIKIRILLDELF